MPSQEEIYQKVSATLVEALNVDEEDVKPTSTLQGDLGAESIDFLDIVFRLEREFGIKIPRGELFPESIFQGDPEFVQDGKVTTRGLDELRSRITLSRLLRARSICARVVSRTCVARSRIALAVSPSVAFTSAPGCGSMPAPRPVAISHARPMPTSATGIGFAFACCPRLERNSVPPLLRRYSIPWS